MNQGGRSGDRLQLFEVTNNMRARHCEADAGGRSNLKATQNFVTNF